MPEKFATAEGTKNFARRFPEAAVDHFRPAQDLTVSSVGIGTYLGNWDEETDANYTNAVVEYVERGGNVIDTAANYRFQRSERNIGAALEILKEKGFGREELVVCTKAGYLPFDGDRPKSVPTYFKENFLDTGIAKFEDLIGGIHCMTPAYLQSQIDQSLRNMNIEGIDVFYVHNPESQLSEVDREEFETRLAAAFENLEENRRDGKIRFYGAASWNGFRVPEVNDGFHSVVKMVEIARAVGGSNHGFKFVQLPFNLALPEARVLPNHELNGEDVSAIDAARSLGVTVVASASILQGKLAQNLPPGLREALGNLETDAQTGIQFARSTPGVTTALVGMSQGSHVEENMRLANVETVSPENYQKLFRRA